MTNSASVVWTRPQHIQLLTQRQLIHMISCDLFNELLSIKHQTDDLIVSACQAQNYMYSSLVTLRVSQLL